MIWRAATATVLYVACLYNLMNGDFVIAGYCFCGGSGWLVAYVEANMRDQKNERAENKN